MRAGRNKAKIASFCPRDTAGSLLRRVPALGPPGPEAGEPQAGCGEPARQAPRLRFLRSLLDDQIVAQLPAETALQLLQSLLGTEHAGFHSADRLIEGRVVEARG